MESRSLVAIWFVCSDFVAQINEYFLQQLFWAAELLSSWRNFKIEILFKIV